MRALIFLSVLAAGAAEASDAEQKGTCLVDSAEAISDLMDGSMFVWAAIERCGKTGEVWKCEVNIASAVQSVNSMINVILKALNKCGDLDNSDCGRAAGVLTKETAGVTAAAGGIVQKCFPQVAGAHDQNWDHADKAMCLVDVKNMAKNLFKTIKSFLSVNVHCEDSSSRACTSNALQIIGGFAGIGQYLAGAIGQCTPSKMGSDLRCASESTELVQKLALISQAGVDLSAACDVRGPSLQTGRLYSVRGSAEAPSAVGGAVNLLLAGFLPVTAIVSFIAGSRFYRAAPSTDQARELVSPAE